jgi:hypothetical protein
MGYVLILVAFAYPIQTVAVAIPVGIVWFMVRSAEAMPTDEQPMPPERRPGSRRRGEHW